MLYPAHGPAFHDGSRLLGKYLEHRQMREDRLVATRKAIAQWDLIEIVRLLHRHPMKHRCLSLLRFYTFDVG